MQADSVPAIEEHLAQSAIRFGKMLRRWRIANGWVQETSHLWGKAAGIALVHTSQWSLLETAKLRQPGPLLFYALGVQNQRLARGEYGKVPNRDLLNRIKGARPLETDGEPWGAGEFFQAYVGQLEWPDLPEEVERPRINETTAIRLSAGYRREFGEMREARGLGLFAAGAELMRHVPTAHTERLEEVLGGASYGADELSELWDEKARQYQPQIWMQEWGKAG